MHSGMLSPLTTFEQSGGVSGRCYRLLDFGRSIYCSNLQAAGFQFAFAWNFALPHLTGGIR